jgi:hypothetical protein
MKYLLQYTYRYCAGIIAFVALSQTVCAQTESDAIMIPKNYLCVAGMYAHNNWDHYWEGTLKRENLNLGTISSNIYNAGVVYGLSNRINISAFVPYIKPKPVQAHCVASAVSRILTWHLNGWPYASKLAGASLAFTL